MFILLKDTPYKSSSSSNLREFNCFCIVSLHTSRLLGFMSVSFSIVPSFVISIKLFNMKSSLNSKMNFTMFICDKSQNDSLNPILKYKYEFTKKLIAMM